MEDICLHPIGYVASSVTAQTDEHWGQTTARIVLLPEYVGALAGLEDFSHALIVTYLHQAHYAREQHLQRRPRGQADMPLVGIFAQRAKDRPNPIGITAVEIISVHAEYLEVRGLDAINETPVIDIKPYYPHYDRVENSVVPEWVNRLMENYF